MATPEIALFLTTPGGVIEMHPCYPRSTTGHAVLTGIDGEIINGDAARVHHRDHGLCGETIELSQSRLQEDPADAVDSDTAQSQWLSDDQLPGICSRTDLDRVAWICGTDCGADSRVPGVRTRCVCLTHHQVLSRSTASSQDQQRGARLAATASLAISSGLDARR